MGGQNFLPGKDDWKKYGINILTIALNGLYIDDGNFNTDIEKIYFAYVSKHNPQHEKQISSKVGWHHITITSLSELLRRITLTHNGDLYCLKNFHSFGTKNKLESQKKVKILWSWNVF